MKKYLVILAVGIFLFGIIFHVSKCQEVEETYQLDLDLIVNIKRVIVKNGTAEVDIHLFVRNFPQETSNVSFLFDSGISYCQINCSGRTNFLQGTLEDQLWYLDGFGELFPFDFYTLDFRFFPYYCQYYFNGTFYGLDSWSYSFQNDTRIEFAGMQRSRLEGEWEIFHLTDEEGTTAYLFRESEVESFQFIFPLVAIQLLLVFSPSFTKKRSIRTTIYSSILMFTPMFIFAIQNFIPPRSTLSIPEFLGINLIFTSIAMIFASLVQEKDLNKPLYLVLDVLGIFFSLGFFWWLKNQIYEDVASLLLLPQINSWVILIYSIFLLGVVLRVFSFYETRIRSAFQKFFNKTPEKDDETEKVDYIR